MWLQANILVLVLVVLCMAGIYIARKKGAALRKKDMEEVPVFIKQSIVSLGGNRYRIIFEIENRSDKEINGFNLKYRTPDKVKVLDSSRKPLHEKTLGEKLFFADKGRSELDRVIPILKPREKLTIEYKAKLVGGMLVQE
ncbi:hypothetical protein JXA85_06660, partial [Candidatus Woesearchaeota archaeon]|nr:hypothetical protein [Candidatus Woesearchaeota archaeon]